MGSRAASSTAFHTNLERLADPRHSIRLDEGGELDVSLSNVIADSAVQDAVLCEIRNNRQWLKREDAEALRAHIDEVGVQLLED